MVEIYDAVPSSSRYEGWTKRRIVFLAISGALTLLLLISVRLVLLPFFLACVIAYVLTPLVLWGETRLRLPRSLSIILVYVLVLGTMGVSITAVAPRIYSEAGRLARAAPSLLHQVLHRGGERFDAWATDYHEEPESAALPLRAAQPAFVIKKSGDLYEVHVGAGAALTEEAGGQWRIVAPEPSSSRDFRAAHLIERATEKLHAYIQLNALEFVKLGQSIVATLTRGILLLFMTLMIAGYMMHTREGIIGFFRGLLPGLHRPSYDFLLLRVDRGLSGVVRGQLLICLVNGLLSAVGFAFLGLDYWPVLALVAGVMSIIPIFGSILSTVPAVLVGLTQDPWIALWVLLWIVGIHQLEANFLNPKIIGVAAKLHPVLVVFALLVGEHYFGLSGALLAVPVLSITQSFFNHFRFTLPDVAPDSLFPLDFVGRSPRGGE